MARKGYRRMCGWGVLGVPPVNDAQDAVGAAIAAEVHGKGGIRR